MRRLGFGRKIVYNFSKLKKGVSLHTERRVQFIFLKSLPEYIIMKQDLYGGKNKTNFPGCVRPNSKDGPLRFPFPGYLNILLSTALKSLKM